jgi:hypothetical protein|tara:strand:+ start:1235 stop:1387 length:153 start_codon:yes stop_codon:yes gene_type:complete
MALSKEFLKEEIKRSRENISNAKKNISKMQDSLDVNELVLKALQEEWKNA